LLLGGLDTECEIRPDSAGQLFFLRTTNQHFCRGLINPLSKNIDGTSSIRGKEHSLVVKRPVERKIVGVVERNSARRIESRSRSSGRELGHVNIKLWLDAVKYEPLAIGGCAGLNYKAVATGKSSGRPVV
jgi:hypothetical protein